MLQCCLSISFRLPCSFKIKNCCKLLRWSSLSLFIPYMHTHTNTLSLPFPRTRSLVSVPSISRPSSKNPLPAGARQTLRTPIYGCCNVVCLVFLLPDFKIKVLVDCYDGSSLSLCVSHTLCPSLNPLLFSSLSFSIS